MQKAVRQLVERLEDYPGVTVDKTSDHPRIYKDGEFVTSLPSTPSSPRWLKNAIATLRRGGIDVHNPPAREREVAAVATVEHYNPPRLQVEPQPVEPVEILGQPNPALAHRVPESEFGVTITAPRRQLRLERKAGRGHSRDTVILEDREQLQAEVLAFVARLQQLTGDAGRAQLIRYVMRFTETYEGWKPKTAASLEQSVYALVHETRASLQFATMLYDAMDAFDADAHVAAEAKHKKASNKRRAEIARKNFFPATVKTETKPEEPVTGGRHAALAERAVACLRQAQRIVGSRSTEKMPFGQGTYQTFATAVIRQAEKEGVQLEGSARSAAGAAKVLRSRVADLVRGRNSQNAWLLNEIELYMDLWDRSQTAQPEPIQEPKQEPKVVVPEGLSILNLPQLLDMIAGRALSKEQLTEAIELSNQLAMFERRAIA